MESSKSKVIKNYIYNTTYQILVLLAPLITTPYVSRVLGVTGIGIYSYAQSIATYFVLVGAVGTTLYGQREIAYVQDKPNERSKVFWQITIFRFVTVGICTVLFLLVFGLGKQYTTVYQILTFEVLATAFDISWFFMGMENFKVTVVRNSIIKLVGIILIFVMVKTSDDVVLYTLCLTAPIFLGNISLWFSLPKYLVKVRVTRRDITKHLRPALILFLPQLATEVYVVLDKTMLGIFASNIAEVGFYTQAYKIIRITLTIVTSLGTVMLPAMSLAFAKGKQDVIIKNIKKAFQFVFLLGFAILFGLCGITENFVPLFFGKGYDKVIYLMIMISPIIIIIAVSNVIGKQYLLPTMQQKAYTASVIAGATVNFVLNLILIARYDAIGAVIATVIGELAVTIVQALAIRKQMNLLECFLPGIKYLICGAIMGVLVFIVGRIWSHTVLGIVIQIIVGIMIYLVELELTKDVLLLEGKKLILSKLKK